MPRFKIKHSLHDLTSMCQTKAGAKKHQKKKAAVKKALEHVVAGKADAFRGSVLCAVNGRPGESGCGQVHFQVHPDFVTHGKSVEEVSAARGEPFEVEETKTNQTQVAFMGIGAEASGRAMLCVHRADGDVGDPAKIGTQSLLRDQPGFQAGPQELHNATLCWKKTAGKQKDLCLKAEGIGEWVFNEPDSRVVKRCLRTLANILVAYSFPCKAESDEYALFCLCCGKKVPSGAKGEIGIPKQLKDKFMPVFGIVVDSTHPEHSWRYPVVTTVMCNECPKHLHQTNVLANRAQCSENEAAQSIFATYQTIKHDPVLLREYMGRVAHLAGVTAFLNQLIAQDANAAQGAAQVGPPDGEGAAQAAPEAPEAQAGPSAAQTVDTDSEVVEMVEAFMAGGEVGIVHDPVATDPMFP